MMKATSKNTGIATKNPVAINAQELQSDTALYQATYIPRNWTGDVVAKPLDPNTGGVVLVLDANNNYVDQVDWSAADQLDGMAWTARKVITYNDSTESGTIFDYGSLSGAQRALLDPDPTTADRMIDFLNAFPWNPVLEYLQETRESIRGSMEDQGITIDAGRLTDVNLLKRHVLKRRIYGVDLNPMAVELAKVSLWLDCFTLGAPLSFLDHHLRCGNSLIGSDWATVEQALERPNQRSLFHTGDFTRRLLMSYLVISDQLSMAMTMVVFVIHTVPL